MKVAFIFTLVGALMALNAWGQDVSGETSMREGHTERGLISDRDLAAERELAAEDDSVIAKAVNEKNYPGARDEDDLEVQAQLVKPVRKMGDRRENTEAPTSDDEF